MGNQKSCQINPTTGAMVCAPSCQINPTTGAMICPPDTAPSCIPPMIWTCDTSGCACRIPQSQMVCEVRIQYQSGDPASPVLVDAGGPWCDAAGTSLAIAVILAKMLGGR